MAQLLAALTLTGLLFAAHRINVENPSPQPPGDVCRAKSTPHPKRDVEIQPYCDPTPTPAPTSKPAPNRRVEK